MQYPIPMIIKLQLCHSLLIWNSLDVGVINGTCPPIMENLMVFPLSLWKDGQTNPSIYFHGQPLEEVQYFKRLGNTMSHDLSWANNIAMLDIKAR